MAGDVAPSGPGSGWRWDVALSFAGAQRPYVERVATALKARGVRCFYDAAEQTAMWGTHLAESLEAIYAEQAGVVVVFVSLEYATRDWTRHELRAALDRAIRERRVYILPARFDDTHLPGLSASLVAMDLRPRSPEEFATEIIAKIEHLGITRLTPPAGRVDLLRPHQAQPRAGRPVGALPAVWNVPPRNYVFAGRAAALQQVRAALRQSSTAVVQALHGLGGVGKTALAVEFAHRHTADYDLVWWLAMEDTARAKVQFAALAVAAGWADAATDIDVAVQRAQAELRGQNRWLLIFDNAVSAAAVRQWLPGGPGHVLITSRDPDWGGVAAPVSVDVLPRAESIALLEARGVRTGELGDDLAELLGDLPLALTQAAGFLTTTGMHERVYMELLRSRTRDLLGNKWEPADYGTSLAAAVDLAAEKLAATEPLGATLLNVCAFLAPEPVPISLFMPASPAAVHSAVEWPAELHDLLSAAPDAVLIHHIVGVAVRYGLGRANGGRLHLHRLTQAVLRDRLAAPVAAAYADAAEALVAATKFDDPNDAATWTAWADLLPHVLAVRPAETGRADLRFLAGNAAWYLLSRGDVATADRFSRDLAERWQARLGPDNENTLAIEHVVAWALLVTGRPEESRRLNESVLTRRRRVLGPDHFDTLDSLGNLAAVLGRLGEHDQALRLVTELVQRRTRLLGPDHQRTLLSAGNLADSLAHAGDLEAAAALSADVLARSRSALGSDHPSTLAAIHRLAWMMHDLGDPGRARPQPAAGAFSAPSIRLPRPPNNCSPSCGPTPIFSPEANTRRQGRRPNNDLWELPGRSRTAGRGLGRAGQGDRRGPGSSQSGQGGGSHRRSPPEPGRPEARHCTNCPS